MNLYIAAHVHHIEGLEPEESKDLFGRLYEHAKQKKYVFEVEWESEGDLVVWDNTCVMHRAVGGSFEGRWKRDMRRATVHDSSEGAWGLNERSDVRQGLP
jgi:alpha-ketoglutarate-dependent 2,4-dichlorophenoxyacetate dioxygenase